MGIANTTIDFLPEMGSFHQRSSHISEQNHQPSAAPPQNIQSALTVSLLLTSTQQLNISGLISKNHPESHCLSPSPLLQPKTFAALTSLLQ